MGLKMMPRENQFHLPAVELKLPSFKGCAKWERDLLQQGGHTHDLELCQKDQLRQSPGWCWKINYKTLYLYLQPCLRNLWGFEVRRREKNSLYFPAMESGPLVLTE